MECLCSKLSTRRYESITEAEVKILKRSCADAPFLFQASASAPHHTRAKRKRVESEPSPRPPKQPRKLSISLPRSPDSTQLQLSQSTGSLSPTAAQLISTYSYNEAVKAFGNRIEFEIQPADSIFARLFLAIERTDKEVKIRQLYRRTCCYVFAKLHTKGTSVDPIILEIKNALPLIEVSRTKIHNILRAGTKWIEILEQLATIATFRLHQATGLLCLLESASS
ncbi:hypothetical protein EJ07DRAFT_160543 [Lizonia empirigonia]|nr:hypothetical protein EJ07DRAFT_160543 [Lizonia empirigonia]